MDWSTLLEKNTENFNDAEIDQWFSDIAFQLLNKTTLQIVNQPYRLIEIEFYYKVQEHNDVSTHGDKWQLTCGNWYFHRQQGTYKSGSFKGLDLTFGRKESFGGVLFRSIESPQGKLIEGPSLCVDHILQQTGCSNIEQLDNSIDGGKVWQPEIPMRLNVNSEIEERKIFRSARVGLTLKRGHLAKDMSRYIIRPYRFFSNSRLSKGRIYIVLGLHMAGKSPEQIHALTNSPLKSIKQYICDFEEGRQQSDFSNYIGKKLKTTDLSQLHGTWQSIFAEK